MQNEEKSTTEKVVEIFLDSTLTDEKRNDTHLRDALKKNTIKIISEETMKIKETKLREQIKKEILKDFKEKERKNKNGKTIGVLLETLLIGFTTGLLVNQITELISVYKGVETIINVKQTIGISIGLVVIDILLLVIMFMFTLREKNY